MMFTIVVLALVAALLLVTTQIDVMFRRRANGDGLWMEFFMLIGLISAVIVSGKALFGLISGF
ncbi:hypothetical protein [Bradyrhizobium sp. Tv2a-2]|uniref:hypothetical protein n=1 Tax=Bradyrhizobium sp. Tv2a-2 TaxID=113395 RepID=UPI00042A6163|nr:hypothetical protein [Bradyrhizobium sp. Tv2a-2]